ncbi:Hsp20/alpha crystallin family protein [Halobacteriaceae archaeon SHR40]|uniref:Hsp20/alpha crystallin family protein n=1 Tax=Halovenus amylolytica TaxID=2500550 RepID=UPI000FE3DAE5
MPERTDPFGEIEKVFEQFSELGGPLAGDVPVDVVDTGDEIVVHADLPGRNPDHISVQLTENETLEIEAQRDEHTAEGRYVTRERSQEQASRSVSLPAAVDEGETEASYDRGVLTVRLQKLRGEAEGTDIPVN